MTVNFEELIRLWSTPIDSVSRGVEAFGRFYSDPVQVNGIAMSLEALVQRALATQRAYSELGATVLARTDTADTTTVVFRLRGRQTGPLTTPLGEIAPSGKMTERQVIDVLKHQGGRITEVWMVGDELSALLQLGAIALR